ncbi:MAG: toll/interleukin-1 receptor domain-containing protein [Methanosarcinaceae archaeon]|uniref:toll/interleukin-1 receptor domain-containing protein n=1 Tax=Methanosarcina sp. Mfa9 TaxID=3439063 RepID=UPI003B9633FC
MTVEKQIFLSYSHKNSDVANEIDNTLYLRGVRLTRDIRDVRCSYSFKEFMENIRNHDLVLMLISDQYLKSQACMFEVLEFMKKSDYKQRIIPIVNDDVNFELKGIAYLEYWKEKRESLEENIKKHDVEKIKPLEEDRKKIERIENNIIDFIATIRDLKYIQFEKLGISYNEIYERIGLEVNESTRIDYDTITEEDVSFGLAKRYSTNILINKDYPKCEIKNALREIIFSLKADNDVIWVFFYNKLDDISNVNWFCRGYWVSPNLDQKWRPIGIKSNDQIEDIEIEWNDEYENLREICKSHSGTKNEVINWSNALLEKIIPIAKTAIEKFNQFQSSEIDEKEFLEYMHKNRQIVGELYLESGNGKYPPYECDEYIQHFHSLFAIADNMFLIHSKEHMNNWPKKNRIILMKQQKDHFYKILDDLIYEKKKIN